MACPFAMFARTPSSNDAGTDTVAGPSSSKLTEQLKSGTWEAHRVIEKSPGVRALMGSHHKELAVSFNRMDHFTFLIMIGSIYVTLEDVLVHTDSALRDMMPLLVRSDLLLDDIQVHLDAIMSSRGASVLELDHTAEDDAEPYHRCITSLVIAAQASLQRSKLVRTSSLLTRDHIALLSTRQARAVQSYLNQVISLRGIGSKDCNLSRYDEGISFTPLTASPSEKSDGLSSFLPRPTLSSTRQISKTLDSHLVLAHAYVRYMGDLSGGQHIVKRLSKLFPIYHFDFDIVSDAPQGFRFYSFTSTGKSNSALKDMIRIRLDALDLSQWDKQLIVDEASQAFLLNGQLLDSLVDEVDSTSIAMEMARSQPRISSLPSHAAMLLSSLHLHHPHTLALLAASLLCAGLASALYVSAF